MDEEAGSAEAAQVETASLQAENLPNGERPVKRRISNAEEPRKRIRTGTVDEEKRRGKRLFGSLLGTLGGIQKEASSAKSQERAAKQAEVEQRQKERLQKTADEIAQRQAEADALRLKKAEERNAAFLRGRIEADLAHEVVLAGFLRTEAGPALHYMPWKLTAQQEVRIEEQLRVAREAQAAALNMLSGDATGETASSHGQGEAPNASESNDKDKHSDLKLLDPTADPHIESLMDSAVEPAAESHLSPIQAKTTSEPVETSDKLDAQGESIDPAPIAHDRRGAGEAISKTAETQESAERSLDRGTSHRNEKWKVIS